jgi:thioredoxin 1
LYFLFLRVSNRKKGKAFKTSPQKNPLKEEAFCLVGKIKILTMKSRVTVLTTLVLLLDAAIIVVGGHSKKQSCPSNKSHRFGPMGLPVHLELRGGELQEPANVAELDVILTDAANRGQLTVIDFTATWCGPCQAIAPIYDQLSDLMTDVVFVKVDVDNCPDIAAKYAVSAMPTFVFIKKGEVIDRMMGANPAGLQGLIEEHS